MKTHTCDRYIGLQTRRMLLSAASAPLLLGGVVMEARATEPCGDFGACKALIEINASDGDIGFHWLADADDLNWIRIDDADGKKIFQNKAYGPLADQKLTETFGESSEPVCREALKEEEDDIVVTLEDFMARWPEGAYAFTGKADGGETLSGETPFTYHLPAAPEDLSYSAGAGTISWSAGTTLGECATEQELYDLVAAGALPVHPMHVPLVAWEAVLDVEDGSGMKFATRLPPGQMSVTVPVELLLALPANTPAKIEVGAIGGDPAVDDDDNATFTELGDLCLNEIGAGCADGEEE